MYAAGIVWYRKQRTVIPPYARRSSIRLPCRRIWSEWRSGCLQGLLSSGKQPDCKGVYVARPADERFYVGGCLYIIGRNRAVLPETLALILSSAVCPKAVAGGCTGGALLLASRQESPGDCLPMKQGLARFRWSRRRQHPPPDSPKEAAVRQALISMTGPFWDTVVLCAITGIAAVGSMVSHPQEYRGVAPENMCFVAFRELPVGGEWMLSISLTLFAFATIIGWNVYGTCAVRYLWARRGASTRWRTCFRLSGERCFPWSLCGDIGSAEFP